MKIQCCKGPSIGRFTPRKTAVLLFFSVILNAPPLVAQESTKAFKSDTAPDTSISGVVNSTEVSSAEQHAQSKVEPSAKKPDSKPAESAAAAGGQDQRIDMLGTDLTRNWKAFSSKPGLAFSDVWKLVSVENERHLICVGEPKGFLYSVQRFDNFELTFEWKYSSDPSGNSGVLVFTNEEPRLWPTSMQIQLHQPRAGSIFPSGDATSDSTTEATDLALEIGKWNTCRVIAIGGRVSVEINGKPAGEVSGCKPSIGSIALQSEGSETHFRRMFLKKLAATTEPVPSSEQTASALGDGVPVDSAKKPEQKPAEGE